MKRFKRVSARIVLVLGLILGIGLSAAPVHASGNAYLWANHGHPKVCKLEGCANFGYVANGTGIIEYCYDDGPWYFGNYWTNRWFLVRAYLNNGQQWVGWVTASFVQNQQRVGNCI